MSRDKTNYVMAICKTCEHLGLDGQKMYCELNGKACSDYPFDGDCVNYKERKNVTA